MAGQTTSITFLFVLIPTLGVAPPGPGPGIAGLIAVGLTVTFRVSGGGGGVIAGAPHIYLFSLSRRWVSRVRVETPRPRRCRAVTVANRAPASESLRLEVLQRCLPPSPGARTAGESESDRASDPSVSESAGPITPAATPPSQASDGSMRFEVSFQSLAGQLKC